MKHLNTYLTTLFMIVSLLSTAQVADRNLRLAREAFGEGVRQGVENNFEGAIESFGRALELDPHYGDVYLYRGLAYIELGLYQEAIDDFTGLMRLDNQLSEQAWYFSGLAYAALGDHHSAIHHYSEAIRVNPDHSTLFQRGKAFLAINEYGNALQDFNMALRLNPGFAEGYLYRGMAAYHNGLHEEALADLHIAAITFEGEGTFHYYMGNTLIALGREQEAVPHLAKGQEPSHPAPKEPLWEQETKALEHRLEPIDLNGLPGGLYDISLKETAPGGMGVQIVSFSRPDNLAATAAGYQQQFGHPVFIQISDENGRRLYKLIMGSFSERQQALELRSRLRDHGFPDSFIIALP